MFTRACSTRSTRSNSRYYTILKKYRTPEIINLMSGIDLKMFAMVKADRLSGQPIVFISAA
jgi:hypothetical protein